MKKRILVTAASLMLAGCGGGGKSALVKSCIDRGEDKTNCACMAEKLQQGLKPPTFALVIKAAQAPEDQRAAILAEMPAMEKLSFGIASLDAADACGAAPF